MEEGEEGAESNSVLPESGQPRHLPWKFGLLQRYIPKLCNHSTGRFHRQTLSYSATQQESRFLPLCTSCSLYLIKLHAHEPNLVHM